MGIHQSRCASDLSDYVCIHVHDRMCIIGTLIRARPARVYASVHYHIYIYIYTHTHTRIHIHISASRGLTCAIDSTGFSDSDIKTFKSVVRHSLSAPFFKVSLNGSCCRHQYASWLHIVLVSSWATISAIAVTV